MATNKPFISDVPDSDPKKDDASKTKASRTSGKKPNKPATFDVPHEAAKPDLPAVAIIEQLADQTDQGFSWGKLFWGALSGLASLAFGVWLWSFVETLTTRAPWLGWIALALTALLALATTALLVREWRAFRRLDVITELRGSIEGTHSVMTMRAAHAKGDEVLSLFAERPDIAKARTAIRSHRAEIMDGDDYITLFERELMTDLDARATQMIGEAVRRVSLVTAVSPRALLDVGYVLWENARLISRIAKLYGGRPSRLSFFKLLRRTVEHLAVTGAIAVGDSMLQQALGQGLTAKISTKLGEGVLNGLLTARVGIAAADVCRPMPFLALERPKISQVMGEVTKFTSDGDKEVSQ